MPLDQWLDDKHPPWQAVVTVFMEVAEALASSHEAGVVHQVVKLDNVVLRPDGHAALCDLKPAVARRFALGPGGIRTAAASLEQRLAGEGPGDAMAYLSPEEFRGGDVDARANQFSFCVAFYRALFGQLPYEHDFSEDEAEQAPRRTPLGSVHFGLVIRSFDRKTISNLASEVLSESVRPAPDGTEVPSWLEDVVRRGLRADPLDRYPSMRALIKDVAKHLGPPAHDGSLRWRPWMKWGAIAFGVGLLVLLAALGKLKGWLP